MDIEFYRQKCLELRAKFGEESYSRDALNDAWQYWKLRDNRSFEAFVAKIITLPWATKLIPIQEIHLNDDYECPQQSIGAKPKANYQSSAEANFERIRAKLDELGASSISEILGNRQKVNSLIKIF